VPRDDDIVIPEKLSYIVVIIDELADLMWWRRRMWKKKCHRAHHPDARRGGHPLHLRHPRPSVDVITGVIKDQHHARIAFQCASRRGFADDLDAMGADKLLARATCSICRPARRS